MGLYQISTSQHPENEVPYPKPPEKHLRKIIHHEGLPAWHYVSKEQIELYLDEMSSRFRLSDYYEVVVNLFGGKFTANELCVRQNYNGDICFVEYHEPERGFGANKVRGIPQRLYGKKGSNN